MLKKILDKGQKREAEEAGELLRVELAEIGEIAERLFKRLDKKINILKSIEAQIDEKVRILEGLLTRVESVNILPHVSIDSHYREINALAKKGLKVDEIANIFDIPQGEVELILNLAKK